MASHIGIKIANGEFYPIMEEGSSVKKRLILTTVHDGQKSVQIDLYKSAALTMADAAYIGSLVVENIAPKPKGDPSIELVILSGASEEIEAEAADLDSPEGGERHHLSVSLQALDDAGAYEMPDFELETNEAPPQGLYEKSLAYGESKDRRGAFPVLPVLLVVAVLLLLGLLFWVFFGRSPTQDKSSAAPRTEAHATPKPAEPKPAAPTPQAASSEKPAAPAQPAVSAPATPAEPAPAQKPAVTPVPAAPAPAPIAASEAQAKRARPPAPVASYKVPRTIPREGVSYKVRWGDTLWDISEAFYRNPWLYPSIARFNKIRNPDLIISGTTIRVPPQN